MCNVKDLLEQMERAAKGDENSTTLRLWNGKTNGLLPLSQPSQELKCGRQIALKNPLKKNIDQLDVEFLYRS